MEQCLYLYDWLGSGQTRDVFCFALEFGMKAQIFMVLYSNKVNHVGQTECYKRIVRCCGQLVKLG